MQQYLQNKKGLVEGVFDQVYSKYDLMNDFMSLGIHRFWKKSLINIMKPYPNRKLIDVACGTGDIGKLFLNSTNQMSEVTCVDPNKGMINQGKQKLSNYKNIVYKSNIEKIVEITSTPNHWIDHPEWNDYFWNTYGELFKPIWNG